jgi:predicted ATPase
VVQGARLSRGEDQWRLGAEQTVPKTVQQAVLRRLEDLDSSAQTVANLAAVIGVRVSLDLLASVSGFHDADLLRALDRLVERHILVESQPTGGVPAELAFRHALTRDAIYDRLIFARRRTIHRRVAEAIEPGGALPG